MLLKQINYCLSHNNKINPSIKKSPLEKGRLAALHFQDGPITLFIA
jgi:hypothetical protein